MQFLPLLPVLMGLMLSGCSSPIRLGQANNSDNNFPNKISLNESTGVSNQDHTNIALLETAINLPLAIIQNNSCVYGHEEDQQKCLDELDSETQHIKESINKYNDK